MHKQGVAAFILAGWSFASCAVQAQDSIERGRYLVEGVLTCGNCHSPRGSGGVVDSTRLYAGGPQTWDEPAFTVKGSNITPDPDTGIGRWSAADMKRAIQEGIRPNGPASPASCRRTSTRCSRPAISMRWSRICALYRPCTMRCRRRSTKRRCRPTSFRARTSRCRRATCATRSNAAATSPPSATAWNVIRRAR